MTKKTKIKVIPSKVKIIKEAGRNQEEEIEQITSSEINLSENGGSGQPVVLGGQTRAETSEDLETSAAREQTHANGETIARFYSGVQKGALYKSVVTSAASTSEPEYRPVENIQTDKIRQASIGRDFSMSQSMSSMPEEQIGGQIQNRLRAEQKTDDRYSGEGVQGGERRERRRYPWEVE